ncbi:3-deoxy-7-phosphoheptulonate synthase [bacterium]|nr:3-deoxy-7-phosphoheptulonate synthase [bacterium]
MIIVMRDNASRSDIDKVAGLMASHNFKIHPVKGGHQTIFGVIGETRSLDTRDIELMEGVSEVIRVSEPYKLAGRAFHPEDTIIDIKGIRIGGDNVVVMAGPCSVENEDQIHIIAGLVSKAGAQVLRGGAFKPRTSPYSFQGLGEEGLKYLRDAAEACNMISVTEVMDTATVDLIAEYADILQIGARNMQNFALLKEAGRINKPIFLKRGLAGTIEELLMAAEYIMAHGNSQVILCERGIRTFETATRNTMDISAIPVINDKSHLPVFADPSHGTGMRDKVAPMARAAVAAGAHGLMIEVHHEPDKALSDGAQSLLPEQFTALMEELKVIAWTVGRNLGNGHDRIQNIV